jgi:hypothetical protein
MGLPVERQNYAFAVPLAQSGCGDYGHYATGEIAFHLGSIAADSC